MNFDKFKTSLFDALKEGSEKTQNLFHKVQDDIVSAARHTVSGDSRRYKENGFDLDLTYITKNIIVMAYPQSKNHIDGIIRNDIDEVARFLRRFHLDHYKIYNVSENNDYDNTILGNVVWYPWQNHHAPPLDVMVKVIDDIDNYINEDPFNVAVIHCTSGKGRAGVIVAGLLLKRGSFPTIYESLKFFSDRRSTLSRTVEVPSQLRYLYYYVQMLKMDVSPRDNQLLLDPPRLFLEKIIITPVPRADLGKTGCVPSISIYGKDGIIDGITQIKETQPVRKFVTNDNALSVDVGVIIQGDTLIKIFHVRQAFIGEKELSREMLFRLQIHTGFIMDSYADFYTTELDDLHKSKSITKASFAPNLRVRLCFG